MNDEDYNYGSVKTASKDKTPQSWEAEQALLGALLYDNRAIYPLVRDITKADHFYNPINGRIYDVIEKRSRRGQEVDAIILKDRFSQDETIEDIGGVEYLARLLSNAPAAAPLAAPEYANLIAGHYAKRQLIKLSDELRAAALDPEYDGGVDGMMKAHRQGLSALEGDIPADAKFITLREASLSSVSNIGIERALGLQTGFSEVDQKTAGMGRGKLVVIAGLPSMGKTSFATNIARNIAKGTEDISDGSIRPGLGGFFSQEMPASELGERAASTALGAGMGVPYLNISAHNVTGAQKTRLLGVIPDIPDTILVDETSGLTYSDIEKRARAMEKRLGGLDFIVIDYLNLMSGRDCEDPRNSVNYYGEICKNLKGLAKKMNIAVILLAQLSRKAAERESGRPMVSDLKGSSGIEDAADIIMLISRMEKILKDRGEPAGTDKKKEYFAQLDECRNKVDIILAKNKGGPLATITLRCFLKYDIITELSDEDGEGFDEVPLF